MNKPDNRQIVFGRRSVMEALQSDWDVREIWIASNIREPLRTAMAETARKRKSTIREVGVGEIQRLVPNENHQGIVAFMSEMQFQYAEIDEILCIASQRNEKPLVAILDEITDPHNLGAIIRSAECAGFHGIVLPKHHAAQINATVMKTSAGAAAHMRMARVTNLVRTMEDLKEKGLWIYGTDMQGEKTCFETDLSGPACMVIGSEGRGMRRLVSEHCDVRMRIPMHGKINSLNASVAAGILFFEAVRQRATKPDPAAGK